MGLRRHRIAEAVESAMAQIVTETKQPLDLGEAILQQVTTDGVRFTGEARLKGLPAILVKWLGGAPSIEFDVLVRIADPAVPEPDPNPSNEVQG